MESDLNKPFLEAARNVFELMLDMSDVTERSPQNFSSKDSVDISIDVVGDLKGQVVYRFPRQTSLSMVEMMSGMEVDTVDEFVISAISEVANIISGNVMTTLAENDLKCDILPPTVSTECTDEQCAAHTECCIRTSAGDIRMDISLNSVD